MRAVVVYESMFGSTRRIAEAIGRGIQDEGGGEVVVVHVGRLEAETVAGANLLVVGGPTHVHGMSRPRTRAAAPAMAAKPGSGLDLDPDAALPGLREWFDQVGRIHSDAAAFDTRNRGPRLLTGSAAKTISRRLRRHGCVMVASPESFLVTGPHLLPGEEARAAAWGGRLVSKVTMRQAA